MAAIFNGTPAPLPASIIMWNRRLACFLLFSAHLSWCSVRRLGEDSNSPCPRRTTLHQENQLQARRLSYILYSKMPAKVPAFQKYNFIFPTASPLKRSLADIKNLRAAQRACEEIIYFHCFLFSLLTTAAKYYIMHAVLW